MTLPTRWIGRWIMAVAFIHTIFGIVVFWPVLGDIARRGFWNSVGDDPLVGSVSWFLLFGAMMWVAGATIDATETAGQLPKSIGVGLLMLIAIGVILMPASGFWLMLPPAIALLVGKHPLKSEQKREVA